MITQLVIKNFRGFDRHTVPLRPTTILVGKNNAGKSTVVEALRLVSMVTNRYKGLTYHPLPRWLDRPRRERGVFPAVDKAEFSSEAVFYRLGEPPAHITAHFQTGETVEVFIGPEFQVVGIIKDHQKEVIQSKGGAFKLDLPQVSILPQIGPLLREELLLVDGYADHVFGTEWQSQHAALHARVQSSDYRLKVAPMLAACADGDRLRHEMAVEAGLLYQLAYSDPPTEGLFGSWGFLHHQVVASPFKPIDYMDRMDLFGYAFIPAFEPTKSRFLVGEIKKDAGTTADLEQLLKYVDWVKDEYAFGDYGMIKAYLIAHDFEGSVIEGRKEIATRRYIVGRRPAKSCEWSDLSLVKYAYDPEQQRLAFTIAE